MKKNLLFISMLTVLTALFLLMCVSCKTTPPAAAMAEEARQRAIDFDAPAYFPGEWEAAEVHYAAEAWELAVEAYNDLFEKSVPLYAQAKEDEIMAVREEIKASGLAEAYPQYLRTIDEIALQAKAQYDAKDYYEARETAATAMEEYSTLLVGARAYQARREIIDRGFLEYDRENFDRADETALQAKSKYDAGDKAGAVESAEEALLRYNLVLESGWTQYADSRRDAARRERELALEEKANIASREIFREADALFNQAESEFGRENFRNAGINYIDAEARFSVSRRDTEEKRLRAEEAIQVAEQKIEESGEAAAEAERIIEGGSR